MVHVERYSDVIRQVLDLKETGLEGLEYIRMQIQKGKFEDTIGLFSDVVHAFASIEQSLQTLPDEKVKAMLQENNAKLTSSFDLVASAYESGDRINAFETIQFSLLPAYKRWAKKLDYTLQPFILV